MARFPTIVNLMVDAVLKASRGLLRDFGEVERLQVSKKGPRDFVSMADKKAEKILIQELQKARPDYSFLTEETGVIEGKNKDCRWIIDPLDGTNNFVRSIPIWCISVGLEQHGEITAGVIYNPIQNELFWAKKGDGAFLNDGNVDKRLKVSALKKPDEMIASCGHWTEENMHALMKAGYIVRGIGSSALSLAYLAAGKVDVVLQNNASLWDTAAGVLLIEEAGGMVTQVGGREYKLEKCSVLATNGVNHYGVDKMLSDV